ncbi:MAG: lysine transporter LysE, partial [Thermoprotei archaeon]
MQLLFFLAKVSLISSSGALAPGPLTAATAALGVKRGWRGGLW